MNKKIVLLSLLTVNIVYAGPKQAAKNQRAKHNNPVAATPQKPAQEPEKAKTVHATKLAEIITQVFNQHLIKHKINPAMVEKFVPTMLNQSKKTVETNIKTTLNKTYRSGVFLGEIDACVHEQMKTLIPRIKNVLVQEWVHSVIATNKTTVKEKKSSSCIQYNKKSLELYDQLTLLHT